MDVLLDQRHMSGAVQHADAASVRRFWDEFHSVRARAGQVRFPEAPGREALHTSRKRLRAYVSDGRWCAQCLGGPSGSCNGGIACWPEHEHGCCLDCGTVYPIEYPPAETIAEAEQALAARPPSNRNWLPWEEMPADLARENIRYGYPRQAQPDDPVRAVAEATGADEETVRRVIRALEATGNADALDELR